MERHGERELHSCDLDGVEVEWHASAPKIRSLLRRGYTPLTEQWAMLSCYERPQPKPAQAVGQGGATSYCTRPVIGSDQARSGMTGFLVGQVGGKEARVVKKITTWVEGAFMSGFLQLGGEIARCEKKTGSDWEALQPNQTLIVFANRIGGDQDHEA